MSEGFLKINPAHTVPTIEEADDANGDKFMLFESGTILRYLSNTRKCPDHWYPKDIKKRAIIDRYMDWHTSTVRPGFAIYVFKKAYSKNILGVDPDPE
mmetsp:Transcript_6056/g.4578  ORF Transcript_6056/g.4578 Transcript_6056/m.4578 type:complete len:98 (+) Transcript_6056:123-416(+)